ncbi:MAG TPA: hypothetical protein VFE34_04555 [Dongiaceae bacterium]|jgi:hypothetical protein|nr:hypothetical protein [Dongiaceae bacterium]
MTNVLPALIAKRSEMAGEAEALQMRVRQILIELDALGIMIRTFQPDIDLDEVRSKQLPPRHAGYRGEVARAVMTILRTEKRPMVSRDIALRVMAERSLNTADKHLVNTIKKRIGACLRHNRSRGIVRNASGPGKTVDWEIP